MRRSLDRDGGGKRLLACPGYKIPGSADQPARGRRRAGSVARGPRTRRPRESVIKELRGGFGLPGLCGQKFFATEAALSLSVFTCHLARLFCRHLGWLERVSLGTLRYRLFAGAGIISRAQGVTPLKLGIPPPKRSGWQPVWEKILSPIPNCNAVAQSP